jgi:hypothetical protein
MPVLLHSNACIVAFKRLHSRIQMLGLSNSTGWIAVIKRLFFADKKDSGEIS